MCFHSIPINCTTRSICCYVFSRSGLLDRTLKECNSRKRNRIFTHNHWLMTILFSLLVASLLLSRWKAICCRNLTLEYTCVETRDVTRPNDKLIHLCLNKMEICSIKLRFLLQKIGSVLPSISPSGFVTATSSNYGLTPLQSGSAPAPLPLLSPVTSTSNLAPLTSSLATSGPLTSPVPLATSAPAPGAPAPAPGAPAASNSGVPPAHIF